MLGELLTRLIGRAGVDEVVNLLADAPGEVDFDAVVTTIALPESIQADVVINLPGGDANAGTATVRIGGREEEIDVDSYSAILRLLDERVPGEHPRAS